MDFVKEAGNKLSLSITTIHIAIAYMDYVLSKEDILKSNYYLIAITCLVLAAKYDELDMNIPPLQDFKRVSTSKAFISRTDEIKECEKLVLRILNWNLRIITPIVFLEVLLTQGVMHSTDLIEGENTNPRGMVKKVSENALFFVNLALRCKNLLLPTCRL